MAGRIRFYIITCLTASGMAAGAAAQDSASDLPGSVYAAFEKEAPPPDGGADEAETVIGAIRAALAHNPQIRLAEGRKDAAKADRFRALGGFLPNIEASATYADDSLRSETLQSLTDRDGTTIGVTAVQPVFQGLSAINRYRAARSRVDQSDLTLTAALQQTALEAARAHAGVVLARDIVQHRIDNMALVNRQLTIAQRRLEAGAQSRTGVEQARMRLAQAQVDLGQARTVLAEQEAAFIRITGRPPAANLVPDMRNIAGAFASLDEAVAAARNNNPLIAAADAGVDAARHAKNAAKGEFAPDLTIEGSYFKRYGESEILAPENDDEEYQLVARMRMPIFRQGNTIADLRGAGALVSQQEAQMTVTLLAVEETVARSWRQWAEAQARAAAAKTGIDAAEQSVKGLEMEYNAGQRTVIDVLDGQRDLVIAQISASQAAFDVRASQYDLAAATGVILEAFLADAE
jgi:outer membrane protein